MPTVHARAGGAGGAFGRCDERRPPPAGGGPALFGLVGYLRLPETAHRPFP